MYPTGRNDYPKSDEFDLSRLVILLWGYRTWITVCTIVITFIGVVHSFLATPVYYSQAVIALKENGKSNDASRLFSQLGGMGGIVASQLGMGNASLDKLDIILRGHELAEKVVTNHGLMPALFPKLWDANKNAWRPKAGPNGPSIRLAIKKLRGSVLQVDTDKKRALITLGARFSDSTMAKRIVDLYLLELNSKIRVDVMGEAERNRLYLENQLSNIRDPVLVEKVHTMIAFEIEKFMLVSNQAFEVLEGPVIPMERSWPKRKLSILLAFLFGLAFSVSGVFLWISLDGLRVRNHGSLPPVSSEVVHG